MIDQMITGYQGGNSNKKGTLRVYICVQVINTNRDEEKGMEGLGVNTYADATTPTLVVMNTPLSSSLPWVWNVWTYSAGDTKTHI